MDYQTFIKKPSVDMYPGIKVTKETTLEYKSETITQELKDLILHTVQTVKGEGFESTYSTVIFLHEGDVLVFEDEGRGYIKPLEEVVSVGEAIEELSCIQDIG